MTGWTCPKCGSVYAPWVYSCARCNVQTWPGAIPPRPVTNAPKCERT